MTLKRILSSGTYRNREDNYRRLKFLEITTTISIDCPPINTVCQEPISNPCLLSHFSQMNSVMNSFFGGDPFGGLLGGMGGMGMQPFGRMMMPQHQQPQHHHLPNALMGHHPMMAQNAMMPFGFMPPSPMGRPGGCKCFLFFMSPTTSLINNLSSTFQLCRT